MERDISQPVQAWVPSDQIHMGEDHPDDGREWTPIRLHDDFEQVVAALEDPESEADYLADCERRELEETYAGQDSKE